MMLDLYLTTDELARLLRYPERGVKSPHAAATKWAKARGLMPGDGGSTKLWLKADVVAAIHRSPRPRLRRSA